MPKDKLTVKHLLVTAFVSLFACVVLGGFIGCDVGLVRWAISRIEQSSRLTLIGAAAGFGIGLIVFLWDRIWAQQGSTLRRRHKIRMAYGAAWLVVAVPSFVSAGNLSRSKNIDVGSTASIGGSAIIAAFIGLALIARAVVKLNADKREAARLAETCEYPK